MHASKDKALLDPSAPFAFFSSIVLENVEVCMFSSLRIILSLTSVSASKMRRRKINKNELTAVNDLS